MTRRWLWSLLLLVGCGVLVVNMVHAQGSTLTVNVTDGAVTTGGCDATDCSLRDAIIASEATSGVIETIAFNIPGAGPHTITIANPLVINQSVIVDATTQPGYNGIPIIRLQRTGSDPLFEAAFQVGALSPANPGLNVNISGFEITRMGGRDAINLNNGQGHVVERNYLCTNGTTIDTNRVSMGVMVRASGVSILNNLLSGCLNRGIATGTGADNLVIRGNRIGTNAAGTAALPNITGIGLNGGQNIIIGGATPAERNLISGNELSGVDIGYNDAQSLGSKNVTIQGNYIGTNAAGTNAIPNHTGIYVLFSDDNLIGGTTGLTPGGACTGACNLLSGNRFGIRLDGSYNDPDGAEPNNNRIEGNFVGTDVSGTASIPNTDYGIQLVGSFNTIGSQTDDAARNLISGNVTGVHIFGTYSVRNGIYRNYIGTDTTGTQPLGNQQYGIYIQYAYQNIIGFDDPARANRIAYNGTGIAIFGGFDQFGFVTNQHLIGFNRIYQNSGLGIDLLPSGVTSNDPGDSDIGANDRQNFPVIDSVVTTGTSVINGTLDSSPNRDYDILFYASTACDANGQGEGETPIGLIEITTDNTGNASFTYDTGVVIPPDRHITATAVDFDVTADNFNFWNTSEFSACARARADLAITGTVAPTSAVAGNAVTFSLSLSNPAASSDAANTVVTSTLPLGITLISAQPSQGTCDHTVATNTVSCSLGLLPSNGTVTVTINTVVSNTAIPGNRSFTATVQSQTPDPATANNTVTRNVQINALPLPGTPVLVAPLANLSTADTTPTLDWNAATNAVSYRVQVATNSTFTAGLIEATVTAPTTDWTPSSPLTDALYYWRVRALNLADQPGAWSTVFSFRVDTVAPPIPTLTSPADGASGQNQPTLSWAVSAGATGYEVQLDTVNPPLVTVASPTTTSYRPTMTLLPSTLYSWRVRAVDAAGNLSEWSAVRSFTTIGTDLPTRNRFATATPILSWNPVSGATGYEIVVDNDAAFTSPAYQNAVLGAGDLQVTTTALPDGFYYWRVRAKLPNGTWGAWSAVETLVVDS